MSVINCRVMKWHVMKCLYTAIEYFRTVVLEAEVQAHPQKFWFVANPGKVSENPEKIRENLDKIHENVHKIPENLCKL